MTVCGRLREKFGADGATSSGFRDNSRVHVAADRAYAVLAFLKDECGFDMLVDVTAIDRLEYSDATDRFEVIYAVLNTSDGSRLFVKVPLNEPGLSLPSVCGLWKAADWLEREVYDMFGIEFTGHPNLRRILMPEEFTAFPLRKDYPLKGRGERHDFPVITRAES